MTPAHIAQWLTFGLVCTGLLFWASLLIRHWIRALRCEWTIEGPDELADAARRAAQAAVDAGINRVTVYRAVDGVTLQYGNLSYDPDRQRGIKGRHHGTSISVDPQAPRPERIAYWETLVNGVGRKMWRIRSKHEIIGRAAFFKRLGIL